MKPKYKTIFISRQTVNRITKSNQQQQTTNDQKLSTSHDIATNESILQPQ
ncbi:hypothetical protein DFA_10401 [Cavenderia fasciculata]|uniref:Uncharacterized protein n=1 Tax=Cavenderia fasciculata TaxID=261658 RepID=F4QA40_CACFS|nr:uncharacterized protein DFA_10401 [Cavenderia fasciculata]EGG15559.1 hypothetical protein DFA_10401 [Cavenderia fasciculata]|eukprot:XP_004354301.1 hypothetical protein DFA_10401 [Cavenderia fasciculata]